MKVVTDSSSSCGDRKDANILVYQILALSRLWLVSVSSILCMVGRTYQPPSQPPSTLLPTSSRGPAMAQGVATSQKGTGSSSPLMLEMASPAWGLWCQWLGNDS